MTRSQVEVAHLTLDSARIALGRVTAPAARNTGGRWIAATRLQTLFRVFAQKCPLSAVEQVANGSGQLGRRQSDRTDIACDERIGCCAMDTYSEH